MHRLSDRLARRLPFFYGYLMIPLAMLMQLGTSPGQTFAVSAFTPALLDNLALSQSRLGLAYMVGTLCAAVPLMLVGPAADRHGLKRVSTIVIFGLAAACVYASTVRGFYGLLAAFFLLRFLGQGSLTLLSGNTTSMWFRSRIGRVSAVLSVGSAIAFALVPDWLASSIAMVGWRATYQLVAALLVVGLLPLVVLLYRNRPEDVGQFVDGVKGRHSPHVEGDEHPARASALVAEDELAFTLSQAARTGSYYILAFSNVAWAMAGTGVLFYLFTLCQQRGMPVDAASGLFRILGLAMLAMQLSGGILADFVPLNRLLGVGTSLVASGLICLYVDRSTMGAQLFAALFGGGQGMLISVSGVAWIRYYGRKHLGSIRGAVWCGTVAGSGCGPLIMGTLQDATGSYDIAILAFSVLMTPLAFLAWFIRPPMQPIV